jgi:hypothetical protein
MPNSFSAIIWRAAVAVWPAFVHNLYDLGGNFFRIDCATLRLAANFSVILHRYQARQALPADLVAIGTTNP